jgi:hypothetical protein
LPVRLRDKAKQTAKPAVAQRPLDELKILPQIRHFHQLPPVKTRRTAFADNIRSTRVF